MILWNFLQLNSTCEKNWKFIQESHKLNFLISFVVCPMRDDEIFFLHQIRFKSQGKNLECPNIDRIKWREREFYFKVMGLWTQIQQKFTEKKSRTLGHHLSEAKSKYFHHISNLSWSVCVWVCFVIKKFLKCSTFLERRSKQ